MKFKVLRPVEIDVGFVKVTLPVTHEEEDIPTNNFPLRDGNSWNAIINVETGRIEGWPEGQERKLFLKVVDGGSYQLLDSNRQPLVPSAEDEGAGLIDGNYVPHGLIPGEYGDYVSFDINGHGVITNWPSNPNLSEFFKNPND